MSDCTSRGCKLKSQISYIAFVEIDCEIIYGQSTPLADSRRAVIVVTFKCTKYWLTVYKTNFAEEKISRLTDQLNMIILTGL